MTPLCFQIADLEASLADTRKELERAYTIIAYLAHKAGGKLVIPDEVLRDPVRKLVTHLDDTLAALIIRVVK